MVAFSNFKLKYSSKHFKEKGKIVESGLKLSIYKEANIRNALVIANTLFQPHKRRLYILMSPDGQYQYQIDYILCRSKMKQLYTVSKNKTGS